MHKPWNQGSLKRHFLHALLKCKHTLKNQGVCHLESKCGSEIGFMNCRLDSASKQEEGHILRHISSASISLPPLSQLTARYTGTTQLPETKIPVRGAFQQIQQLWQKGSGAQTDWAIQQSLISRSYLTYKIKILIQMSPSHIHRCEQAITISVIVDKDEDPLYFKENWRPIILTNTRLKDPTLTGKKKTQTHSKGQYSDQRRTKSVGVLSANDMVSKNKPLQI